MKFAALLGAAALSIAGLSACSSGSTTAAASPEASMVGGMTTCDLPALDSSLQAAAQALGPDNVVTGASVECADGWAVVSGVLGTGETATDAPQGAPTSFIFEAEGQFWIPKDRATVCKAPGDQVPAAIYEPACETN